MSSLLLTTLDTGNTAWMIMATILVLLMSIPGIALFYGGLVRQKNILSILMQTVFIVAVVSLIWVAFGYSWAFSTEYADSGNPLACVIGGFDKCFLHGIGLDAIMPTGIPELTFAMFQCMFALITPALILGAFAERVKFSGYVLFTILWVIIAYLPMAHWVWGGGFLQEMGAIDFAGGTVVHVNAAVCGLTGAFILGRRHDLGRVAMAPHNLGITYIGACLLWIGWLGFNAGSELVADGISSLAFINTVLCPATAAMTWMVAEWIIFKKPSTLGTASGVLAGLVAITPACAFVGPMGAIVIGVASGLACLWGVHGFKKFTKVDDSLDVFGVHGIGAIVGGILTGVFCAPSLGGTGFKDGWDSIVGQVYGQTMSLVVAIVWSLVVSVIAFKIAGLLVGLRVTADEEAEGLDLASHGERGYNL